MMKYILLIYISGINTVKKKLKNTHIKGCNLIQYNSLNLKIRKTKR